MSRIEFIKTPKTYQEQLDILQERGMIIKNKSRAKFLLENISYYRLSGYWFYDYIDFESKIFKNGATFENAFYRYCFDKEFRKLLLSELEKIEVALRSNIVNTLSSKYNSPFWYLNNSIFVNSTKHINLLEKLKSDFNKSDELFVKSYKIKYRENLPPSWIMFEITSFGTMSKLYENLNNYDKRLISSKYNLPEIVFVSWLHSLVYIRNVCAHHTRLWNRNLTIKPILLKRKTGKWMSSYVFNQKSYYIVLIIKYLLITVNPNSTLKEKLLKLFENYPTIDKRIMGFSENWEKEEIWN